NLIAQTAGDRMSTSVKYIPQMTAGLDPGWDAGLFDGGGASPFSLFTHLVEDNGVNFTIQCLPDNDYENLVVPVGLIAKQGTTVEFSLADVSIPAGYKVFLEDRLAQKFTRIDEQGSVYSVQLITANSGTGQFFLHTKHEITGIEGTGTSEILVIPMPQQQRIRVSGFVNLPAQATVYDMNGKMITIKTMTGSNENDIPLQGVSSGIYLLKIKSAKETNRYKITWTL
ncbi:MAG TPA: T9SS type A sorting domain-containing protein, partial [Draconibacterium sp.]|nr:T9SS type A sorting domain-containing protein [Draconibacterium sp.]